VSGEDAVGDLHIRTALNGADSRLHIAAPGRLEASPVGMGCDSCGCLRGGPRPKAPQRVGQKLRSTIQDSPPSHPLLMRLANG
jgi:hypothetical protein